MGGAAFATASKAGEPPLVTPRMTSEVYHHLRYKCSEVINKHYATVKSLIDAPGKSSFGDIDFLVQRPLSGSKHESDALIAEELKAKRTLANGPDIILAIPCPIIVPGSSEGCLDGCRLIVDVAIEDEKSPLVSDATASTTAIAPDSPLGLHEDESMSDVKDETTYAQLDIRYYPSTLSLSWIHYLYSFGDTGQILGYLGYELGITSNDLGFHIRVQEQESSIWSRSMIFLSNHIGQVMAFLNLDQEKYERGFATEQELFEWISTSRTAKRFLRSTPVQDREGNSAVQNGPKRNADHKRRMETRPMFNRFITTVLPTLPMLNIDISTARKSLLEDALSFFGKRSEYDDKLKAAIAETDDEKGRVLLVQLLTNITGLRKEKVNEIIRGIRQWVSVSRLSTPRDASDSGDTAATSTDVGGRESLSLALREEAASEGHKLMFGILLSGGSLDKRAEDWISGHWLEIRDLERRRVKASKAGGQSAASTREC